MKNTPESMQNPEGETVHEKEIGLTPREVYLLTSLIEGSLTSAQEKLPKMRQQMETEGTGRNADTVRRWEIQIPEYEKLLDKLRSIGA